MPKNSLKPKSLLKQRPVIVLSAFTMMAAMGMAGCAKDNKPTVATANPGTTQATGGTGANQASPLKFSQCMRAQGLTWYPDPQADGGLKVSVPDGTDQSKVDKAADACKAYAPGAAAGGKISSDDLDKIRQVSQCMRDKGYSKYPDPDANGSVQIDSKVLGVEPTDAAFQAARQACQKYMPSPKTKANG